MGVLKGRGWPAVFAALACSTAVAVTSGGATAAVPTGYTVVNLGTLGGSMSQAEALNDQGDVVGSSTLPNGGSTHAFLYRGGTMRDLGTLGGATSRAYDVNENGVVVGDADLSPSTSCSEGSRRAFLFDGQLRQLNAHPLQPPLTSMECHVSGALAINDRGDVVGYYNDVHQSDGRAWELTDGKSYAWGGRANANDINNSGTTVMTEGIGNTAAYVGSTPWLNGIEWKALTFDGRARWGTGEAINEKGWVVGGSDWLGGPPKAFLYRNSGMEDLGMLPGADGSRAYGLNEVGDVVGSSPSIDRKAEAARAVIWSEGHLIDLNTLIPTGSGWVLENATDINNRGQIVGVGSLNGQKRAFLLNPPGVATLTATPATVESGSTITVSWDTSSPTSLDWIGLYNTGAADTAQTKWLYTSSCTVSAGTAKASGSCALTMPTTAGTYELRLFKNGGHTRLATFGPVTVAAPPSATVSATPASATAGGTLTAAWQRVASPTSTDWIGLYKPGAADTAFTTWVYTSTCALSAATAKASGSCPLIAPATPGTYELRLFTNNGYTRLATSGPVTVTAPMLTSTPASVSAGGSLTVAWQGVVTPTNIDWIGLYKSGASDGAFVSWLYNSSCAQSPGTAKASGSCSVKLPSAAGTYELRLFKNGGFTRLATSGPVTVTA